MVFRDQQVFFVWIIVFLYTMQLFTSQQVQEI